MKNQCLRLLVIGFLLALPLFVHAQIGFNSPTGVTPKQDVEMYSRNGFLWQQKYTPTSDVTYPTYTMTCGTSLSTTSGILLDPGGTGNYPASFSCVQTIKLPIFSGSSGYEITFDFLDTEADGDSIILEDAYGRIAFSGNVLPPVLLVTGSTLKITFKSDSDRNLGAGFQLRWRLVTAATPIPIFGHALQFDATKGSLVAGLNGIGASQQAGRGSVALGIGNLATGEGATALGAFHTVKEDYATALGYNHTISGFQSSAIGAGNKVSASYSTALGFYNKIPATSGYGIALGTNHTVSGQSANAIGYFNVASGAYSTAMGNYASTGGFEGAFSVGDNSTTSNVVNTANNQFMARFAGGYRLFSNSATTLGVQLQPGAVAWSTLSDSTKKERFLPLNHANLLANIRALQLGTWNYKGQRTERHYGPMAQEFFARFGHDALGVIGCDTLINSHDFTAVTLSGVQALALENEQLKAEIAALKRDRAQTSARLEALERAVLLRPTPRTSLSVRRRENPVHQ